MTAGHRLALDAPCRPGLNDPIERESRYSRKQACQECGVIGTARSGAAIFDRRDGYARTRVYTLRMRTSGIAILTVVLALLLSAAWSPNAGALTPLPLQSAQATGLSVEAKTAPTRGGFEFKFRSDNSSTTLYIDPLGFQHTASGSLSSRDGSIALSGCFERQDRTIKITATRSGTKIGEYSWRVEAVLR